MGPGAGYEPRMVPTSSSCRQIASTQSDLLLRPPVEVVYPLRGLSPVPAPRRRHMRLPPGFSQRNYPLAELGSSPRVAAARNEVASVSRITDGDSA